MLDDETIQAIQADMKLLDPDGYERVYNQQEHRRKKHVEYNRRAYLKRKRKQKLL